MTDYEMRSDVEIASIVKGIYIESKNCDNETLSDHWSLSFNEFYDILFKPKVEKQLSGSSSQ